MEQTFQSHSVLHLSRGLLVTVFVITFMTITDRTCVQTYPGAYPPQAWPNLAEQADDVVLITMQYMHSTRLSQAPIVFIPVQLEIGFVTRGPMTCAHRNALPQRTVAECLKTASVIEKHPEEMHAASTYLCDLVA